MDKDPRFVLVKELIENGDDIQKFRDIFLHIPVTVVATQIGISYRQLREAINTPDEQKLDIFFRIAEALEVNTEKIYRLTEFQLKSEKDEAWLIKYNLKSGI